ncbi:hypothetical protein NE237_018697 [Protea cynaroides]|uniref:FAE domain-containing protein n=1 Tax=Protea cynaroides TaxID=273540 RepID=A0A9Q0KAB4_9MAGN|nr:hypothetical protein NE237_018697 [Protea cynaroides]
MDQADDSDVVSQMRYILESNHSSIVADQICDNSHKLGIFQVLIDRKINYRDLHNGIFSFNDAKWKEQRPCRIVRSISKGFRISMDKRDQPMDAVFLDELCFGIAYKSNKPKVVMSPENCTTMKEGRVEALIVMFGALDELFEKTRVRLKDISVLVRTSLGSQVNLEALRVEELEVVKLFHLFPQTVYSSILSIEVVLAIICAFILLNLQKPLLKANLANLIKLEVPCNADAYESTVPSQGAFYPEMTQIMINLAFFLNSTGSSFLVNIDPFQSLCLRVMDLWFFWRRHKKRKKKNMFVKVVETNTDSVTLR